MSFERQQDLNLGLKSNTRATGCSLIMAYLSLLKGEHSNQLRYTLVSLIGKTAANLSSPLDAFPDAEVADDPGSE